VARVGGYVSKLVLGKNFFPLPPTVDAQGRTTYHAEFRFTTADLCAPLGWDGLRKTEFGRQFMQNLEDDLVALAKKDAL
jgi:hypothetical protein